MLQMARTSKVARRNTTGAPRKRPMLSTKFIPSPAAHDTDSDSESDSDTDAGPALKRKRTSSEEALRVRVSRGFPITVLPKGLADVHAAWSPGSAASLIDAQLVRRAGLQDRVRLVGEGYRGSRRVEALAEDGRVVSMKVRGSVEVTFNAQGYEFMMPCLVVNIAAFPVKIILGSDWAEKYKIGWGFTISSTDAEIAT